MQYAQFLTHVCYIHMLADMYFNPCSISIKDTHIIHKRNSQSKIFPILYIASNTEASQ